MISARMTLLPAALLALVFAVVCPARAESSVDFRIRLAAEAVSGTPPGDLLQDLSRDLQLDLRASAPPPLRETIAQERIATAARGVLALTGALEELGRWARVSVPESQVDALFTVLAGDRRIDRIEPVQTTEICALNPDDPLLRNQEGWLEQTGLRAAWAAAVDETARRVRVAIIDGGTEWQHPDLLANVAVNELEIDGDGIDQDQNGFVDDVRGWNFPRGDADPGPLAGQAFNARHGTHVAGIVGGVLGNGIGIAGAGGNPELILVNAAHPSTDGGIAYGYEGILYAISRGADIINCSWRTVRFVGGRVSDAAYSEFEALVLRLAAESGALVVAAVGNDFAQDLWTTPAGYESVLSVAATNVGEPALWPGSNRAPWIDLVAPGQSVASTYPEDQSGTLGAYGLLSGTSMAAAVTSGVAALLKREHPEWTIEQLKARLRWTALDAGLPGDLRIVRADSALTAGETPGLGIVFRGLADEDGDGLAEGGETIDLKFDISAAFESQVGVTVETWTEDPWLVPLIDRMGLPSVPAAQPLQVLRGLKYWVHPSAPAGHVARIQLRATLADQSGPNQGVGPVESGAVRLRPLSATLEGESLRVTASANGALGQPAQYASDIEAQPALVRVADGRSFLRRGALLLGNGPDSVSDGLLGRAPGLSRKDFYPQGDGVARGETASGVPEATLVYADRGAPDPIGVNVEQRIRSYPASAEGAFVIFEYEVGVFDEAVTNLRWGLALDWMVPAADGAGFRGFVDERFVVSEGLRGLRVEGADPDSPGTGVAGVLVLGDARELGFSGLAQWSTEEEDGWNIPSDPDATASDGVLWSRMAPGIDDATLGPTGDRVAILSGALGSIEPGSTRSFVVAMAIGESPEDLSRTLERARLTWEAGEIGLTPETLSTGMLRFTSNPFRSDTELSFVLAEPGPARVDVYDLRGRRVRTLMDETREAGVHRVGWNGRDQGGAEVASGVYLVRLVTRAGTSTDAVTRIR